MSVEENLIVNGSELKSFDFQCPVGLVGLPKQEINGEFNKEVVEVVVSKEIGLDSLIEEEMGKVSLVGASEFSNPYTQNQGSGQFLSELTPNGNGVGGNEVQNKVPISYEVLGELNLKENSDKANEVPLVVKVEYNECSAGLKLKGNGDGNNGIALVTNPVKDDGIAVNDNAESRERVIDGEGGSSSSDSDSETESESSTSSSSSSLSSEEEDVEEEMVKVGKVEEGEIKEFDPEEIPIGSDEDEPSIKGPIKSKNELEVKFGI